MRMSVILYPFASTRRSTSPVRFRATPSGLTRIRVSSMCMVLLNLLSVTHCSRAFTVDLTTLDHAVHPKDAKHHGNEERRDEYKPSGEIEDVDDPPEDQSDSSDPHESERHEDHQANRPSRDKPDEGRIKHA